jgi:opacity protein-like surface antigen
MRKRLTLAALLLCFAVSSHAQNWSFGAATGPFIFGDFVERRLRPGTGTGEDEPTTLVLTAATRVGIALDVERSFSDRFAMRLEGTFTRAPLATEQRGEDETVEIEGGELDVSTWMLPFMFRINPRGAFRFHVMAGPALAIYRARAVSNVEGAEPAFADTRAEWGYAAGAGVGWWISDRFAIEGNLTDTVTSSPFDRDEFPPVPGIEIKRPHNVHTTVGVRWKF